MYSSLVMLSLLEILKLKIVHVDPAKVSKIIVNESTGKTPEQYVIRDINFNFRSLVATTAIKQQET